MGTLKDIASLFVNLDEETPAAPKPEAAPAAAPTTTPLPAAVYEPPEPLQTVGSDPGSEGKISEKLTKAMEDNNLQGIDFFEFRKTLEALVGVIADEPTRYRAAYGSLVAQGAKPENLINTADHYLKVLDTKEASFAQHVQDQTREKVDQKLAEADRYKQQIQEKSEAIARLTQEIGKLTEQEVGARNAAALGKAELEAYKNSFLSVKARFTTDIQGIREKISLYVLNMPKA